MNMPIAGDLVDDVMEFFSPMSADLIDGLMGEYGAMRKRVEGLGSAVRDPQLAGALFYFVEANTPEQRHSMPSTVEALFDLTGAIAQLNAEFWNRALRLTDVIDYMPQARRNEWFEQISNPQGKRKHRDAKEWEVEPLPEFDEETVRATLAGLMASRSKFFAERVDGIFRSLSREHVTNCPQGFNKRMIIPRVIGSFGTIEHSTSGYINDLRCVIAKFMGRDEPKYGATDAVIRSTRRHNGQWTSIDGGALRMRIYNGVGTAHLEVHPDMAWRLNGVLASMYPNAIPAEFRTRPKRAKKIKEFTLFDRPLPFAVIDLLAGMKSGWRRRDNPGWNEPKFIDIPNTLRFDHSDHDKAARAETEKVLDAIGGVREKDGGCEFWRFDYEPGDVIDEIVCSGRIPDQKSHQFYPTPESLADAAVELAMVDAEAGMAWLEPSAGQGALADRMPAANLCCVEVSPLHCQILRAKEHQVIEADFLKWQPKSAFDRIVMNPPFSEGRWQAHLQHAATMLRHGGRLVAILPSSAKGKDLLPGWSHEWSRVHENEFAGASVDVVILTAVMAAA